MPRLAMHTEPRSTRGNPAGIASILPLATGLGLYLLTLLGEVVLGAGMRWLLCYLGAAALGALVPLEPGAETLAWLAAAAPLAWSLAGLLAPGRGLLWGRRLGARRPTASEADVIATAMQQLRGSDPALPDPAGYLVLDDPMPRAAVRGLTVLLSRGVLEVDSLPAVLAHEIGHADSLDGRLTEALARLSISADPLAPAAVEGLPAERQGNAGGGAVWGIARWTLRLAGGGCAEQLLRPLWCAYWRAREYAADAYAASLGQAETLAEHLAGQEQDVDLPQPGLLFNFAEHPPVARRIERLRTDAARRRPSRSATA